MMMRAAVVISSLLIFFSCRSSVQIAISRHADPDTIKRVAIFKMERLLHYQNDRITDLLVHEFVRLGFDVVERAEIEKLIKEQKLGASGFIDPDKAVAIGKLAGADAIVTGSGALEANTDDILKYFTIKVIDLKTGSVIITANLVKNMEIKAAVAEFSAALRKCLKNRRAEKAQK